MKVEERFWPKVDMSGGPDACWPWTAGKDAYGYGATSVNGKMVKAHRLAYELSFGALEGKLCLHRCDNPPCCNPAHLFAGTHATNSADKILKGRQAVGKTHGMFGRLGEKHPNATMTQAVALQIRQKYAAGGISQDKLAAQFGVSQSAISLIVRGKRWGQTAPAQASSPPASV